MIINSELFLRTFQIIESGPLPILFILHPYYAKRSHRRKTSNYTCGCTHYYAEVKRQRAVLEIMNVHLQTFQHLFHAVSIAI